jgi:dTDP-4-amino-4,6-dideoxygalactose transaminase
MTTQYVRPITFQVRNVPLLDLNRDNGPLREKILDAIANVFDSGRFLHGPDVTKLEAEVAAVSGTAHAIGCASGSDALLLALMAAQVGPGDEVIVPSFTFFATASAVWRLGARVVFADIDAETFNLDPECLEAAISPRTKAVIPVHLFGQCANMERICKCAARHQLLVVEDAAQAIGAAIYGRAAGSWGKVGCFSFYPTKNIGGCGDGGMLTTSDDDWEERLRLLAAHGMHPRYIHHVVGINSRLDSFQAAALRIKLRHLLTWTEQRLQHAARYRQLFEEAGLHKLVQLPSEHSSARHVWNQFTVRIPGGRRDAVREHLARCGVATEVYYPCPLHLQECFRSLGYREGSLPQTERAAREVLSLPIFPGLTADEQRTVVGQLAQFYLRRTALAA